MESTELVSLLDTAARDDPAAYEIAASLRKRLGEAPTDLEIAAYQAFSYMLLGPEQSESRERYGEIFAPMFELSGTVFPPYLSVLPREVFDRWNQIRLQATEPGVLSRLSDLLWTRKYGEQPHLLARAAVEHYVTAAESPTCDGLVAGDMLARAQEISKEINDGDLRKRVGAALLDLSERELSRDDAAARPGVYLPILQLLAREPAASRSPRLPELVERADRSTAALHPFTRRALFDVRTALATSASERAAIRRAEIEQSVEWALSQEGLLRVVELGKALELAEAVAGTEDLRDSIRRHLQDSNMESDLQTVSAETSVPREEVDRLIEQIAGRDSLHKALQRVGGWGPPTGDPEENRRSIAEAREAFPFQFLVSRVITNQYGWPIRYLETDEDKSSHAVIQHEVLRLSIHGLLLQDAFKEIGRRYSPGRQDLVEAFERGVVDPNAAEAFARAFEHYQQGLWDEAVLVALPRIESVLRGMLRDLGGVVYRPPRGKSAGGAAMLGEVLQSLRSVLDEGWWRFLWVLLVEPLGMNLRNEHLHGLVQSTPELHAALIMKAACYLSLLALQQPDGDTSDA